LVAGGAALLTGYIGYSTLDRTASAVVLHPAQETDTPGRWAVSVMADLGIVAGNTEVTLVFAEHDLLCGSVTADPRTLAPGDRLKVTKASLGEEAITPPFMVGANVLIQDCDAATPR